jgi:hypothetical protein
VETIALLRELRMTGAEIALCLAMPLSTYRWLRVVEM